MSIATPLSNHVSTYNYLKESLKQYYELEGDDTALLDTLDGESDLKEVLAALAREADKYEQFAVAMKVIIADNKARQERFEAKADKLRQSIAWAMQETGLKKVEAPDVTLSLRNNQQSLVTTIEPESAPAQFRTVKTTYAFDKKAIREALLNGDDSAMEFASLNNQPPSLQIRSR